ncbi:MAG: hypothetical protein ABJA83_16005 [Burkholderiaceae bacterium]
MHFAPAAALILGACAGQKADAAYTPRVAHPAYVAGGPVVCIDEAHNNAHTADGLYRPLAELLVKDGFRIRRVKSNLFHGLSDECKVFVSVNAAGGRTYRVFGLNLPTRSREHRHESAFAPAEIDRIQSWVRDGGSLLLVADHYPYGSAASALAHALGVDMSGGLTEASNVDSADPRDHSRLSYSRENGLLRDHPITNGRSPNERVRRVVTFTGQSVASDAGVALLVLGDSAVDYMRSGSTLEGRSAAGRAQCVALELGKGRVVVMAEAAALTAQIDDRGHRFGMQLPGNDNQQFALNTVRWLARTF